MDIVSIFNNREIATAIWLTVFVIWSLTIMTVRSALIDILKTLFTKKILIPLVFMLLYTLVLVSIFGMAGFWDTSVIKDTIFWFFGVAFVMFINSNKVADDENFFKSTIADNIKLILVFEFIVNLYTFNLAIELIVIPVVTFIAMLNGFCSVKPEYQKVKKILDACLNIFGLVLIVFTIKEISADFSRFATLENLRDFLLPIVFTFAFFPFIYFLALYSQYELLFIRLALINKESGLIKQANWKIFSICRLNLYKLKQFSRRTKLLKINTRDDLFTMNERFLKDKL